jgi:ADP-heptose:LPS heptosyltransferase
VNASTENESTPRIVVLRALNLGDLLVAVPALRAIRRHWPRHRIVLATSGWLAPIVALADSVDELLPTNGLQPLDGGDRGDRGTARPWLAINLHGRGPQSNAVLDALEPMHRMGHGGYGWNGPPWADDLHERHRWCRMLHAHGVPADPADLGLRSPLVLSPAPGAVVVHPGAGYGSRHWPPARYAAVASVLARQGHRVVVTGSPAERPMAASVVRRAGLPSNSLLAGRTPLAQLAALVADARLVICADTGVAHLSYAYGTPSVVLFGPSSTRNWGPPASGPHVALCREELRRGDPFATDPDPALLGIDPTVVVDAVQRLLAHIPAYRG